MHALPKGVMCELESAELAAIDRTNQTKSIGDLLIDRPSDRQSGAGSCEEISSSHNNLNGSNAFTSPGESASLANASNEPTLCRMSHLPVHSSLALDSAAKSSMKRNGESAGPNRTDRFGRPDDEPRAVRSALPPTNQPATCSHPSFSSYLLSASLKSSAPCSSHPAVARRLSPPPTRSFHSAKLSHPTPHPASCSPKATKPNSIGKLVKASRSSIAFSLIINLILQLLANDVQAASTAFDYQNNQADNSIVYQGTRALLIIRRADSRTFDQSRSL